MCLGIPMQIIEINEFNARCSAKGVERDVSLFMLQHETLAIGDHVMVHVGYAIQKMTEQEANSTWELFDEILSLEDEAAARA
jgi:hydrogenase expression/formation protein HypC